MKPGKQPPHGQAPEGGENPRKDDTDPGLKATAICCISLSYKVIIASICLSYFAFVRNLLRTMTRLGAPLVSLCIRLAKESFIPRPDWWHLPDSFEPVWLRMGKVDPNRVHR